MRHILPIATVAAASLLAGCSAFDGMFSAFRFGEDEDPKSLPPETLIVQGMDAYDVGDYSTAIKSFKAILDEHPFSAQAMLAEALAFAKQQAGLLQIHLGVTTSNTSALRLYQAAGFSIYGTEPAALCIDGQLFDEYLDAKYSDFKMTSLEDYHKLKKVNQARSKTQSKFVRANLMDNFKGNSNGESAYQYFTQSIKGDALYILDEPENSLSAKKQIELVSFLEEYARYEKCQFIISTHSPFLLSMRGAKIYDMDASPVDVKHWTELDSVRTYQQFFKKHEQDF